MATSKELEGLIAKMLKPLKGISLNVVIEGLSGKKILPFDKNDEKDKTLLQNLIIVARTTLSKINEKSIIRPRPNEVGNDIEPFVKEALVEIGYNAETPKTKNGKHKSSGYPDIVFVDEFNRTNYLECKTYNIKNVNTTQRAFYLSPSKDFKITEDAHHFILSFEIEVVGKKKNLNIYKCKSWKILSLENLKVDVKYEFNSDNSRMYIKELIIAEGKELRNNF